MSSGIFSMRVQSVSASFKIFSKYACQASSLGRGGNIKLSLSLPSSLFSRSTFCSTPM